MLGKLTRVDLFTGKKTFLSSHPIGEIKGVYNPSFNVFKITICNACVKGAE